MPDKTASVKVQSMNDLIKTIKKSGAKGSAKDIAHDLVNHGSGSILLDGVGHMIETFPKGEKILSGFKHMQDKLSDIDIRLGSKVNKSLSNGGVVGKTLGKAFVYNHEVPLKPSKAGKVDKVVKIGVPMITAPVNHATKVGLPLVGGMVVADKIVGNGDKNKEGGEDIVKSANISREQLMDKIANHVAKVSSPAPEYKEENRSSVLLKKASDMLKFAAEERKQMLTDMEKLACENRMVNEENQKLRSQLVEKTKKDKATKLASEMNEKGMIKKAEIDSKINEIMALDDDAFNLLKQATENVQIKTEKIGADSLTFLHEDFNIRSRRKTLADAIDESFEEDSI